MMIQMKSTDHYPTSGNFEKKLIKKIKDLHSTRITERIAKFTRLKNW